MFKLISLSTRMATDEDAHLPTYDHTKLSAINTCPTWGILRYSHHKRMPGANRAMALEAGSAAHEAFAAVRWYQYKYVQAKTEVEHQIAHNHGLRLFPNDRFDQMLGVINETSTHRTNCINFAIEAIESCDFYDDVSDNRRTVSNISEAIISYVDSIDMDRYPIWVRDNTDPLSDIGIEIAFDVVVDIEYESGPTFEDKGGYNNNLQVRFTGKLDGLHIDHKRNNQLIIEENKTGARLDDSWLAQWVLSHQITGYCVSAQTFTGLPCTRAIVAGMRLPIGKNPSEGIRKEVVNRHPIMFDKWAGWFVTTILMENEYRDNVVNAPMYTHSCNRYFRACSFLPFCSAESVEEKEQIIEEMELDEWSPLHEGA
jgi:hypothetical protein